MAHLTKFKAAAVGNMLHHYERDRPATLERSNIDESRTRLNYAVGTGEPREFIERAIEEHNANGRSLRGDAVVMADWVITAPQDLREEDRELFFETAHEFCAERYGERAVPQGYVHMDETTPHMHQPIVPLTDEGRMQASKMLNRQDLKTFHRDLGERVDERLGYHVSVEVSPQQKAERRMNHNSLDAYKQTERQIASLNQSRDALRYEVAGLERDRDGLRPQVEQLRDSRAELARQVEEEQRRLEEVRQARIGAEERVVELGREVDARRAEIASEGLSREDGGIGRRIARGAGDGVSRARRGGRELGEREREAGERNRELGEQKSRLVAEIGGIERECGVQEKLLEKLGERIEELERGLEDLRERVNQAMERAQERVSRWIGRGRESIDSRLDRVRGGWSPDGGRGYDPPDRGLSR